MSRSQMARDIQTEFEARFQAKSARREAQKALAADRKLERDIEVLLKNGDTAKAYQKARLLLQKQALAQKLDSFADMAEISAEQIKVNNAMTRMTGMMASANRTKTMAQRTIAPDKTLQTMERYNELNEEYAVSSSILQDAMTDSTNVAVSDDAVQELMARLADAAGVQLDRELNAAVPASREPAAARTLEATVEEEDALQERLRALRA